MTEPHLSAWADQFGALLRDKCREMMAAILVTNWDSCAHAFVDPVEGGSWRLIYTSGFYYLQNIDGEHYTPVLLDLDSLGVFNV